jgi:hypothetical protein
MVVVSLLGILGVGFGLAEDLDRSDWVWVADPHDRAADAEGRLAEVSFCREAAHISGYALPPMPPLNACSMRISSKPTRGFEPRTPSLRVKRALVLMACKKMHSDVLSRRWGPPWGPLSTGTDDYRLPLVAAGCRRLPNCRLRR